MNKNKRDREEEKKNAHKKKKPLKPIMYNSLYVELTE